MHTFLTHLFCLCGRTSFMLEAENIVTVKTEIKQVLVLAETMWTLR